MFAALEGLNAQEMYAANVRTFVADGTPYLFVPGLKSVSSVRVGGTTIPLEEMREFPMDADHKRFISIPIPLISLQFDSSGNAILLRNELSNDGIWQPGVNVYVGGEWDEGVQEPIEDDEETPEAEGQPRRRRNRTLTH